jgi:hypothetical protein
MAQNETGQHLPYPACGFGAAWKSLAQSLRKALTATAPKVFLVQFHQRDDRFVKFCPERRVRRAHDSRRRGSQRKDRVAGQSNTLAAQFVVLSPA